MFTRLLSIGMTLTMLLGISAAMAASEKPETINWLTYDQARAQGVDQAQKYFLYFNSKNCGYCRLLENETFNNPDVLSFINTNYIPVRIDVDRERSLATRYRIQGVPDLQFLSKEGAVISRWVGFTKADHLLNMLKFIHTDSYLKMNFKEFINRQ